MEEKRAAKVDFFGLVVSRGDEEVEEEGSGSEEREEDRKRSRGSRFIFGLGGRLKGLRMLTDNG